MTKDPKVLFVASECAPFAKVGGLGDISSGLPKELQKLCVDVRVILPLYRTIDIKKYKLKPVFRSKRLKIGKSSYGIGLWSGMLPGSKVMVYFVENKKYLGSGGIYFSKTAILVPNTKNSVLKTVYKKEIERFVFFSDFVFLL